MTSQTLRFSFQPRLFFQVALATLLIIVFVQHSGAQEYQVFPKPDGQGKIEIQLSTENQFPLVVTKKIEKADTVSFFISPLRSEISGNMIDATFGITRDSVQRPIFQMLEKRPVILSSAPAAALSDIIFNQSIFSLIVQVEELPDYQKYSGVFIISRNQKEIASYTVSVSKSPDANAEIIVDQPNLTVYHTIPLFPSEKDRPVFMWHLHEKSRKERLYGIYARLIEHTNPDFGPKSNLIFSVNGQSVSDFWKLELDSAQSRSIKAGEQASVQIKVDELPPGEYTAKLKFLSQNAKDSDNNLGTLTLKIKDNVYRAILCITIAIAFSFFANKWLKTRRQKLEFRKKLHDLNPSWLRSKPPTMGMIKARATLKLVDDLSRRWYLSSVDVLNTRLEETKVLLMYLDRARQLRKKIENLVKNPMKRRRATKKLRQINELIGRDTIDEKRAAEIEVQLDQFESWFQPGQFDKHYGEDLEKDVNLLLEQVNQGEGFPEKYHNDVRQFIKELNDSAKDSVDRENKYAALKVLWERRNLKELGEYIAHYKKLKNIDSIFEIVDKAEWEALKKIAKKGELTFKEPNPFSPELMETYQPVLFTVYPNNPMHADNYLFKHGLQYEWEIDIIPNHPPKIDGKERALKLQSETEEPQVVQYIPYSGRVLCKVTIRYKNDDETILLTSESVYIKSSSVFGLNKSFQTIEWLSVGAAWLVAVASGLLMFYIDNDIFGQLKDYITLFLWGAGADQTKNFIQNLEVFSKSSNA